jgi:hypothetical protein
VSGSTGNPTTAATARTWPESTVVDRAETVVERAETAVDRAEYAVERAEYAESASVSNGFVADRSR